ncbi:TetR/AcrR family transcriptional regulator [Sphingomonas sp. CL5.1]|uniref:TetR/AcrR family transcriptional regulator n=1 Tax=Sphingomonas sp. CL5.1 TaxID=2653203 RepID=UPI0015821519|nr:TetR/AcrR family transcriptional regulator [Sphingomonas sp. CL5.1]QKS00374.1 TetR/AcrR family transcriptional regulator [Sphingomonas sp. CL5.1]
MSRREENNEKRRRKLLAAARTLFDRQGFEATTVAQIAKASKSALRTVYNVFPAKIDILAALLSAEAEVQLTAGLAELTAAGDDDPQHRLMQLLEMLTHIFTDGSRAESRLVTAHAISMGRSTLAGQIYDDIDREVQRRILDLLLALQAQRAFRDDVEAEPLARLVFNAVNGLFFLWLGDDAMTSAQCLERLREHVVILIPRRAPGESD